MFRWTKGRTITKEYVLSPSTAVAQGDMICPNLARHGEVTTAGANSGNLLGIAEATYPTVATTQTIAVRVPAEDKAEFEGIIGAGTFNAAEVGRHVDLHSRNRVAAGTRTRKHLWVVRFINSTTGIFRIAAKPENVQFDGV